MSDLIERLRREGDFGDNSYVWAIVREAADALETAQTRIANLELAGLEARKTIDRAHTRIAELDPQFNAGSP